MEHNQAVVEAMIASGDMADRQERRYALLQATATILRGFTFSQIEARDARKAVDAGEVLLMEIEAREKTDDALKALAQMREPEKQA